MTDNQYEFKRLQYKNTNVSGSEGGGMRIRPPIGSRQRNVR